MSEAERYSGVSLVLCYAPCIMHGIGGGMCNAIDEAKIAVDTGYWSLYRCACVRACVTLHVHVCCWWWWWR